MNEIIALYLVGVPIWLLALFLLCRRRDVEIHRKLSWVVVLLVLNVVVLNVVGALLYFLFGPARKAVTPDAPIDPDAKPVEPYGTGWNPILGQNSLPLGQGLNPKGEEEHRTSGRS